MIQPRKPFRSSGHLLFLLAALGAVPLGGSAPVAARSTDVDPSASAAKIAAAATNLELERSPEARRWLAAVPETERGWAWRYLSRRSDLALGTLIEDREPLVAFAATAEPLRIAAATRDGRLLLRGPGADVRSVDLGGDSEPSHAEAVSAIAFSGDGARVAVALPGGGIRVLAFDSGAVLESWSVEVAGIGALAWSPVADQLAIGGFRWIVADPEPGGRRRPDAFLELRAPDGGRPQALPSSGFYVGALAFSPDGSQLAAGAPQGRLDLYSLEGERERRSLEIRESPGFPQIEALAFSPDGSRLGAACGDGTVHLFSTADATEPAPGPAPTHRAGATAIRFLPDGHGYATGGADGAVRLVGEADGSASGPLLGHREAIVGLAATPDGLLLSASEDGTVRHWSPFALERPLVHDDSVWGAAFSPDGALLATAGADGRLRIWDGSQHRLLRTIDAHEGDAVSVGFSADARELVSAGNDGRLRIWSVEDGSLAAELEDIDDGRGVALALSPDGATLAAGSTTGTVKLWNLAARSLVATLSGHQGEINQALWLPDGTRLVTAAADGDVVVWDTTSGSEATRFHAHDAPVRGAALAPDGAHLATAGDDRVIRIWDLASGTRLRELRGHTDRVWSLAWSPDGELLASASNDFTARLWQAGSGLPLITWTHPIQVYRALWSPRGATLVLVPFDGRVRLLDAGD